MGNGPKDPEVPHNLQDSSHESENDSAIEKDSSDESDTGYAEPDSTSDEENPRRRAKREHQMEQPEVKIFSA